MEIVDLEKILDPENIDIDTKDLKGAENIKDILTSADTIVNLERARWRSTKCRQTFNYIYGIRYYKKWNS